jgi:hypothetical protein
MQQQRYSAYAFARRSFRYFRVLAVSLPKFSLPLVLLAHGHAADIACGRRGAVL